MGCSWLVHPLPLRERVGRGVAPASSTLLTRRLVVPSPLTRPSATLSRRRGFLTLLPPGEGAAQRRMRGKRRCLPRPSPGLRPPSPEGEGFHPSPPGRRCRAAADEGETPVLAAPLIRPSATLSPGEGAAQRRMRGKRRCLPRPSPGLRPPSPEGEGFHPSPPGRRCRAAADEGETPVLAAPLTRPSATLSPGEGAAQRRMRGKRRCLPRPSPGLRPPSPEGEGFHPSPPGRRCRAAADEGETPVLAAPLTRPS